MEENNHIQSDVIHLKQRIENTEKAIINLNTKFDKMEANVSDKFEKLLLHSNEMAEKLLSHSNTTADKLHSKFDNYKDSKQIGMTSVFGACGILIALVTWGSLQYSKSTINETKHAYVSEIVSGLASKVYVIETEMFTKKEGHQLIDKVNSIDSSIAILKSEQTTSNRRFEEVEAGVESLRIRYESQGFNN